MCKEDGLYKFIDLTISYWSKTNCGLQIADCGLKYLMFPAFKSAICNPKSEIVFAPILQVEIRKAAKDEESMKSVMETVWGV